MAARIPALRISRLSFALPSIAHDPGSTSLRRGLRGARGAAAARPERQTALMLAFILSVTNLASIDDVPLRVVGWLVAGGVAVLVGGLVWPRSSHVALRGLAASVIRAVAVTIATAHQGAHFEREAREQLASLRRGFVVAQRRPSGATRRATHTAPR